jgi:prepilin-type N-terminal cleavage/methylation domain-containing protein
MYQRKGFSLVELLIVVLILGVLAAIAVPRIIGGTTLAKTNACKINVDVINAQMELYKANAVNDEYPTLAVLFADPNYFPDGTVVCPFGTSYSPLVNNRVVDHTDTDHGL